MQNKKNSKIISKLVLSTTAAFMATMAVKATEEPNDVQSQVENFQQEDQLQVAYAKGDTITTGVTDNGVKYAEGDSATVASVTGYDNSKIPTDGCVKIDSNIGDDGDSDGIKDVSVTAIAGEAFKDCDKLVSVEIPSTVETIGKKAFANCENLEYIKVDAPSVTYGQNILDSSKDVKFVYVAKDVKTEDVAKKLGLDSNKVRNFEELLTKDKITIMDNTVDKTFTENGIKLEWDHNTTNPNNTNIDLYVIKRDSGTGSEVVGVVHRSEAVDNKISFTDTESEFGKTYTYEIIPYDAHSKYKDGTTKLTADNFETYEQDIFGLSMGKECTDGGLKNLLYDEFTKEGVTSYYTTVDVGSDSATTTVDGSYATFSNGLTRNVYSLQGNAYGIAKPDTSTNFKWEDGTATSHQALLYVREWDIENKDKTEWDKNAGAENKGASRVFSLQVVKDENNDGKLTASADYDNSGSIGYNYASKMVSGDHDTTAKNFTMYAEMDESWGNDVSVYAIRKDDTDIKLTSKIVDSANGIKGRFLEVTLGEFYYGPYAIYADKLENAGTNSSELCETCKKPKDECTCKKDECPCDDDCACKKEDGTCECGKNDCKCTGTSSSTSHGYKTGDVASAGLLQAAFGMLAAAGSTLMGLFRKKKDRE